MVALTRAELASPFVQAARAKEERIGIEVEVGVVDQLTGACVTYEGKTGLRALLESLLEAGGEPVLDSGHLTGIKRSDGTQLTLELGGALEYSSPPLTSLATLTAAMQRELDAAAEIAKRYGAALLSGGNLPFNNLENAPVVPKQRVEIMRRFFSQLSDAGSLAAGVRSLTLSTQVSLDYQSEEDLSRKLRMQMSASPIVAALFANSPLEDGRWSGALSRRAQYWFKFDSRRCGCSSFALQEHITIDDIIDWALNLPMIYCCKGDRYEAAPQRSFAGLMKEGFDDGTMPTLSDWVSHLSQIWPHVRIRNTLELRVADGPLYRNISAVPAFWAGLTYHAPSREAAWELLRGRTLVEHERAMHEVAVKGLAAQFGDNKVQEIAAELVRLAKEGLSARIEAGLEQPEVLSYLEPVEEVADSGETFAEVCLRRWQGEFQRSPALYVDAYRI